MEPRLY